MNIWVVYAMLKNYIAESLEGAGALKGEKGDKGDKGAAFTYADFTPAQLAGLKGEQGIQGIQGIQGEKGDQGIQGVQGEKGDQGEKGEAFKYSDFTAEQLAALKGPQGPQGIQGLKGDSYVITSADYDAIAEKVEMPEIKLNGQSIEKSEDGSINIETGNLDTTIGKEITVEAAIGGISAGTTFSADTSLATIIAELLKTKIVVDASAIYVGVTNTLPTSNEEIRSKFKPVNVTRDALCTNGYKYTGINTDDQMVCLALPKALGLYCESILVSNFGIGFDEAEIGDYLVYYDDLSTLSRATYIYNFEEA